MFQTPEVMDHELRTAGFTSEARKYPLSERAVIWLAAFNGVPIEKMPAAWYYAPNSFMQNELEEYAFGARVIKTI